MTLKELFKRRDDVDKKICKHLRKVFDHMNDMLSDNVMIEFEGCFLTKLEADEDRVNLWHDSGILCTLNYQEMTQHDFDSFVIRAERSMECEEI